MKKARKLSWPPLRERFIRRLSLPNFLLQPLAAKRRRSGERRKRKRTQKERASEQKSESEQDVDKYESGNCGGRPSETLLPPRRPFRDGEEVAVAVEEREKGENMTPLAAASAAPHLEM